MTKSAWPKTESKKNTQKNLLSSYECHVNRDNGIAEMIKYQDNHKPFREIQIVSEV